MLLKLLFVNHTMIGDTLFIVFLSFYCINGQSHSNLWPKGVVHYAINPKDYDIHSQDEIMSTLNLLQKEICVKFFNTPYNYTNGDTSYKILYISNPDKRKGCTPAQFNFNSSVVDMVIGYKCLDRRNIAATVVDMLRASVVQTETPISSFDLLKKFKSASEDTSKPGLLTAADRNYINAHYHDECGALDKPPPLLAAERRFGVRPEELHWYRERLWPLGVVMYTVAPELRGSADHTHLKHAMTAIELASCVVFQFHADEGSELQPASLLQFGDGGEEAAALGVLEGWQPINLTSFMHGAPGHSAHALNNLMRALGVPMMSNRHDRDNYVAINWANVATGKGHYLEKTSEAAWIQSVPYDWTSVTHAPANYMCADCSLGQRTVEPLQEHLWQRTLTMGHRSSLSASDRDTLYMLYSHECRLRSSADDNAQPKTEDVLVPT